MDSLIFLISLILTLPFLVTPVLAGDIPTLIEPVNDSETLDTSPKLSWEYSGVCPLDGNCFNVQVDDDVNFGSLNKDTDTKNLNYSPILSLGTFYWRVKAKDSLGVWGGWSNVFKVNIVSVLGPSPSPSSSFSPTPVPSGLTPSPTPTATPTPTPTATPTATPTPTAAPKSVFNISNLPSSIGVSESVVVEVELVLPSSPSTNFYLKGAFVKSGSTNYQGFTEALGSWIKNSASYSSQKLITTNAEGKWSGVLEVKPDGEDSGYIGNGDYVFKVGRYTLLGSGPTWSNESNIYISGVLDSDNISNISSPTPKPSVFLASPTPVILYKPIEATAESELKLDNENQEASVEGEATNAAVIVLPKGISKTEQLNQEQSEQKGINWWFIGSGFSILLSTLGFFVTKKV